MRRVSPWLPVLLVIALAGFLIPQRQVAVVPVPVPESRQPALPDQLPPETLALFRQSRPATVRVEAVNMARGTGGIGTGFFISESGDVLTAYHVVSGGQLFQVTTLSGKALRAKVKGFDAARDVALLEVQGGGTFPYLKLTTRAPRIGETVLAIGNSGGDYLQPRRGQLLALEVAAGRADFPQGTLEMTAPLAPGDSGGPIVDGLGQAIGVVSYIRQNMNGTTRTSYAVPVVEGNDLIQALRAGEKRDLPVVGLVFDPTHSGQTNPPGAVVLRVAKGSPGERAGLRGCQADRDGNLTALGDVITSVNGVQTPDPNVFIEQVRAFKIGESVTIAYVRDGQPYQTTLTLAAKENVPDLNGEALTNPCTTR